MTTGSFQMMSARNELNVGDDDNDDDAYGDDDEEELDPRVQEELEHLNTCTDEINQVLIRTFIRSFIQWNGKMNL